MLTKFHADSPTNEEMDQAYFDGSTRDFTPLMNSSKVYRNRKPHCIWFNNKMKHVFKLYVIQEKTFHTWLTEFLRGYKSIETKH